MNDAAPLTSARSYLDFSGLGELRGKAQRNDDSALRETAQQFEAMFIQMMLKSMRDASNEMKSDLVQSDAAETFEGMYDKDWPTPLCVMCSNDRPWWRRRMRSSSVTLRAFRSTLRSMPCHSRVARPSPSRSPSPTSSRYR